MSLVLKNDIPRTEALISSAKHHLAMGPFARIRAHGAIASWPEQGPSSTNSWEMDAMPLLDHVLMYRRRY